MSPTQAETTRAELDVAVGDLAEHFMALVLAPRDRHVKHRRPPKSSYVDYTRRDCKRGRAKPAHRLIAISFADAEDATIPIDDVTEPFKWVIAMLEARRHEANAVGIDVPSLLPLNLKETRREYELNVVQQRMGPAPVDRTLLEALLARAASYRAALTDLEDGARQQLAALDRKERTTGTISAPFERTVRNGRVTVEPA